MQNAFVNLLEKVIATYVQAVIALLLTADVLNIDTAKAFAIAAIPAALTVIANGLPQPPSGLPFYVDLLFRTVRTYVVAFIGLIVAVPMFSIDVASWKTAAIAAIPAALAVVKGALASKVGNHDTAALLPADPKKESK